jgi:hypothetical protein
MCTATALGELFAYSVSVERPVTYDVGCGRVPAYESKHSLRGCTGIAELMLLSVQKPGCGGAEQVIVQCDRCRWRPEFLAGGHTRCIHAMKHRMLHSINTAKSERQQENQAATCKRLARRVHATS